MEKLEIIEIIPGWLNRDFVEDALKNHFKDNDLKVIHIKNSKSGGCGESYASTMFRVSVSYRQNNLEDVKLKSVIIKTLPQNEMAREKLGENNFNVQKKEMKFYSEILPKFKEILFGIGENKKIVPTLIAVNFDLDVTVLEDLNENNFKMADRLKGLDIDHLKLSLSGLAKIHAASMILYEKDKKSFEGFEIGLYNRKTTAFDRMYLSNLEAFTEEVESWTDWTENTYYASKLKTFQKTLIENGCKVFDFDEKDLNVFLHGDFWTNNIMFTYDSFDKPSSAIIIDFQYSLFGSAALDLLYFLFSSASDHLRIQRMEELVQFYFYELKNLMKRLKYDMKNFRSLQSFQVEFLRKYFYGFSACLLTVPTMINQEKDATFEAVMGLDEHSIDFKRRIYKNPRVRKLAMETLPIFDRKGIFDEF